MTPPTPDERSVLDRYPPEFHDCVLELLRSPNAGAGKMARLLPDMTPRELARLERQIHASIEDDLRRPGYVPN